MTENNVVNFYTDTPEYGSELIDVAKLFMHDKNFVLTQEYEDGIVHKTETNGNAIKNTCSFCNQTYSDVFVLKPDYTPLEAKRYKKRYAKLSVYYCLKKVFDRRLPWGALTGIRPTKLAWEITDSEGDFKDTFKRLFDVSDAKIEVAAKILDAQKGLRISDDGKADIYVGIPFCTSRCSYCSFTGGEISRLKQYVEPYFNAVDKEIAAALFFAKEYGLKIKNVYFGGGTPTALPLELLDKLLNRFDKLSTSEFTVEAGRPDTINDDTFKVFKNHGVNRISINPQTFCQRVLNLVGRKHTVEDIIDRYQKARKYDFVINMDFIAGLPTETKEEFFADVDKVAELSPDNVTIHTLALKKGSILKEQTAEASDDGRVSDMVDYAYKNLVAAGYQPYYLYRQKYMADNLENIGYCKQGKQSLYNIDIMEETTSIIACGSNSISKRVFGKQNRIERLAAAKDLPTYLNNIDVLIKKKAELFKQEQ